jgi:hypothetical protein
VDNPTHPPRPGLRSPTGGPGTGGSGCHVPGAGGPGPAGPGATRPTPGDPAPEGGVPARPGPGGPDCGAPMRPRDGRIGALTDPEARRAAVVATREAVHVEAVLGGAGLSGRQVGAVRRRLLGPPGR